MVNEESSSESKSGSSVHGVGQESDSDSPSVEMVGKEHGACGVDSDEGGGDEEEDDVDNDEDDHGAASDVDDEEDEDDDKDNDEDDSESDDDDDEDENENDNDDSDDSDGPAIHPLCGKPFCGDTYQRARGKSPLWRYIVVGRHGHDNYAFCCICQTRRPKHHSNLRKHMIDAHPGEATRAGIIDKKSKKKKGGENEGTGVVECGSSKEEVCTECGRGGSTVAYSEEMLRNIRRCVAALCVRSGRPFCMGSDPAFVRVLKAVSAGRAQEGVYPQAIRDNIDVLYKNCRILVMESVQHALPGSVSLSSDGWTASNMDPYMGLLIRHVDSRDLTPRSHILACKFWTEAHDAPGTLAMICDVLEDWGISEETIDYVATDNASVMIAAINMKESWGRIACASHWLQLTLTDGLLGNYKSYTEDVRLPDGGLARQMKKKWVGKGPEEIGLLVKKMRRVATYYKNNPTVKKEIVLFNAEEDDDPALAFLLPNNTRWSGVYLMAKRLVANSNFMQAYLQLHLSQVDSEEVSFSPEEVQAMAELVAVLEMFYYATQTFQDTSGVVISLVFPTIVNLEQKLRNEDTIYTVRLPTGLRLMKSSSFTTHVQTLVKYLAKNLRERWWGRDGKLQQGGGGNGIYFAATFLDPRVCRRPTMTREYRLYMHDCLKKLLEKDVWLDRILTFLRSEAGKGKRVASEVVGAVTEGGAAGTIQKKGRSHLDALLGEESVVGEGGGEGEGVDYDRQTVKKKALTELAAFACIWNDGPAIHVDGECPLEGYWRAKRDEWPCLTYMAFAILWVPPSSADVERLFSKGGFTLSPRRMNLDPERFNKLLVTQGNWDDKLYKRFDWEIEEDQKRKEESNKKRSKSMAESHKNRKDKRRKKSNQQSAAHFFLQRDKGQGRREK